MSKKQIGKSRGASDPEAENSVYDFLYHDARRVGSFLAQLDPDGHLQSLKKTTQTQKASGAKSVVRGSGGIPGVAQMSGDSEDSIGEQVSNAADRVYDPLWANALALLDYLSQRGLITRDMPKAGVGQLVLLPNVRLSVLNLKVLETLWGTTATANLLQLDAEELGERQKLDNAFALELVQRLPHMVQAIAWADTEPKSISWMILDEDNMVIPASTIMLKYGSWISGRWNVLCIKDADIDEGPIIDAELQELLAKDWDEASRIRFNSPLALLTEFISPIARKMMGRLGLYYGATPILIFREVAS